MPSQVRTRTRDYGFARFPETVGLKPSRPLTDGCIVEIAGEGIERGSYLLADQGADVWIVRRLPLVGAKFRGRAMTLTRVS